MLYIVFSISKLGSNGPAYGVLLIVAGAVIGIIGGFCVRRSGTG